MKSTTQQPLLSKPKIESTESTKLFTDDYKNDVNVREREIRRYYKKYEDKFVTPAELKARHILFKLIF